MKTVLQASKCVLLLVFAYTASAQETKPDPKFHIYLCFGQSNMEAGAKPEEQDKVVDERFLMMAAVDMPDKGRTMGHWYRADPPLNRQENGLGPVDFFGRAMVENMPEEYRVGVINASVAGARIELWGEDSRTEYIANSPGWLKGMAQQYGNDPYLRLVEMAKLAQKDGVIHGILLHQGESNTGDREWCHKVKEIYDRLIADLELDPARVPLLAGEVVNDTANGRCASFNTDILPHLPKTIPNTYIIPSANCPEGGDRLHFSRKGFQMLGNRYALTMLQLKGFAE